MAENALKTALVRNSTAQGLARGLEFATMFVLTALVARSWGTRELGALSVVTTLVALATFAADGGINLLLMREIARSRDRAAVYLGAAIVWTLGCLPVASLGLTAAARALRSAPLVQEGILVGALWMALGALIQLFRATVLAFERSELDTLVVIIERSVALALGIVVVNRPPDLRALLWVLVLSRVAALTAFSAVWFRVLHGGRLHLDRGLAWKLGWAAMPFGMNILATTVYVQSDIVLLSLFRSLDEVGYYRAATALALPFSTLGLVVSTAQVPVMARVLDKGRRSEAIRLQETAIRYGVQMALPVTAVLLVEGPRVVTAAYGPGYTAAVLPLQLLAFSIPVRLLNGSLAATLTAAGRQYVRTRIVWAAAGANLMLNLATIPRLGAVGAGLSTVLSDVLIMVFLLAHVRRVVWPVVSARTTIPAMTSAAALVVVLTLLRGLPLGIAFAGGGSAYLAALSLMAGRSLGGVGADQAAGVPALPHASGSPPQELVVMSWCRVAARRLLAIIRRVAGRGRGDADKYRHELAFQARWAPLFAHHLDDVRVYWRRYRYLDEIQTRVPLKACRILDVGCGISTVLHFIEGHRYGVDPLAHLYRTLYAYPPEIILCAGQGEALPFRDASFDVVFCSNVLDHVTSPERTVAEMARVLRPGGYLVLTVEIFEHPRRRDAAHPYSFTASEVRRLLHGRFVIDLDRTSPWIGLQNYVLGRENSAGTSELIILARRSKAADAGS
ncbi:MAG: methyltransferase domain-containing protein [Armatimonadota bacterium]|nr:methyltransferase domain-containing protein [Armatimonadota bacterium]